MELFTPGVGQAKKAIPRPGRTPEGRCLHTKAAYACIGV